MNTHNSQCLCTHECECTHTPYAAGSDTCSSMKQPKPDKLVVTLGMPITVHSPGEQKTEALNDMHRGSIKHLCRNMYAWLQHEDGQSTRCVAPWFIVGREHSKVTTTDKILVVHWQQRTSRGQELRVENNLRGWHTDKSCPCPYLAA